jgi:hypothetical protein
VTGGGETPITNQQLSAAFLCILKRKGKKRVTHLPSTEPVLDCDKAPRECSQAEGVPRDRCLAGCCALGSQAVLPARGERSPGGLSGPRLVWRALVGLILPGLLWIGVVWQLSGPLGELAACGVGVLGWLLLLLLVRATMLATQGRIFRTARQGLNADRAGVR